MRRRGKNLTGFGARSRHRPRGRWVRAWPRVRCWGGAIFLVALISGCAINRAAEATEALADEIRTEVAPAVVALAQSGQRTTDALGDFWDTLKGWGAWAAWIALLSTWGKTLVVRPLLKKWKGPRRRKRR